MFRNLQKNLFRRESINPGDKPPSLPEHLQMTIDIANSFHGLVSNLVEQNEPVEKVLEEMEPLHKELVNLLQGCIEVNKENDKRQREELDSSKYVMEQVQSQLGNTMKQLTETQTNLKSTKDELQKTKDELKQTKKDLKETQEQLEEAQENARLSAAAPSDPTAALQQASAPQESADVQLMQSQVASLQQKLEHRQSRIDNLQHILSMKDREHETELTRQKARASMMMIGGGGSDNEEIQNLQNELEETREELEQVRDELEQQTELMIEAEDKLKEADQAIFHKTQMEDRLEALTEALQDKTQTLHEVEAELEQMHEIMEQSQNIMNDKSTQLEEQEMELNALRASGVSQATSKPAVDEGAMAALKEELKQTLDQLEEREDEIKKLKDDLQNTKEIMDIQAGVIQDYKNNPAPAPAPAKSYDSDEEYDLGKIPIEEHMETVRDLQEQLEVARDKIAEQSRQIHEQHQKINEVEDAPWRSQRSDRVEEEPQLEEMQRELDIATERNERLEKQIEEIEDHLEEVMREVEQQAAQIQSKDEEIRSLERAQEKGSQSGRDDTNKTGSSEIQAELEDKERIIESLEMQLLEADEAIQQLQKEHLTQRKSMAATNDTAREERESFIESLEMQLEDADTAIRKFETRIREKDKEIKNLENELGDIRNQLKEAEQSNDSTRSRGLDSADSDEKKAEIARLEKKLKDAQAKATREEEEVEEKQAEIIKLEKKLKEVQAKANRDEDEVEEKEAEIARLEKKMKELQAKANRAEDAIEDKEEEIVGLAKKVKELQAEASQDEIEKEEKDAEIARLEKKLKNATANVSDSSDTEEKDAEIARLKKKLKDQHERALSKEEDKDAEISRLEKKLKAAKERASVSDGTDTGEKDAEIARLEKKLKEVQERAMSKEEFEGVQKALLHADKSMKKGQKQITKLTEQLEGMEKAKAELEQELATVQEQIEQKDAKIKSLELTMEGAEASLAMSQDELQAQAKEMNKIKQTMQGATQESREVNNESEHTIKALREENDSQRKEIGSLREELTRKSSESEGSLQMDKLKASLLEKEKLAKKQEQKIEQLNASVKTLKDKLKAAGAQVGEDAAVSMSTPSAEAMTYQEMEKRFRDLEQQQAKSAAETQKKEIMIHSLRKELDSAKEEAQKLVVVRKELEDSRKKIIGLATASPDGSSTDAKIKSLQEVLEQQQKDLVRLRTEKQSLEEKLGAMESAVGGDKSIQSLEKEIGMHEKDAMIASLEKDLQTLTSSDNQATKSLPPGDPGVMGEELALAQKTISDLQKEIGDLEGNMKQALSALIKEKDSEIARLNDEFDTFAKVVVEKEAEIGRLKVLLGDKEQTLAMTVKNQKDQAAEIETLKGRISGLECERDKLIKDEETKIQEFEVTIGTLRQQLEVSEESIRKLQRKEQEDKRKSIKAMDDTQSEIDRLKNKILALEAEVSKKNEDKKRIKELEAQVEREVEQSIDNARKKQSEIDVLTTDLINANSRIEDLGELVRSEREKKSRKISKDEHRIIDLADRLEQEIDHSESLKKQLDTYKHSLKAKRKIIDSQANELRDCQDKLDMHDSIQRKAKRKMKQLENEIWNLEGELENINMYLQGRRPDRHRGHGGGGRHARGRQPEPYIDDVPVNQYLDHFSDKVLRARRELEAAQNRMYGGR